MPSRTCRIRAMPKCSRAVASGRRPSDFTTANSGYSFHAGRRHLRDHRRTPAGKWSEPHLVQAGNGLIDPCPCGMTTARPIWFTPTPDREPASSTCCGSARWRPRLAVAGRRAMVFHDPRGTHARRPEISEEGRLVLHSRAGRRRQTGWQIVLRSRNIYGPYEDKIVLEQGSTAINGPHQGALVDRRTANGGSCISRTRVRTGGSCICSRSMAGRLAVDGRD